MCISPVKCVPLPIDWLGDSVEMSLVTQLSAFDRCASHFSLSLCLSVVDFPSFRVQINEGSAIKLAIFALAQQICPHKANNRKSFEYQFLGDHVNWFEIGRQKGLAFTCA